MIVSVTQRSTDETVERTETLITFLLMVAVLSLFFLSGGCTPEQDSASDTTMSPVPTRPAPRFTAVRVLPRYERLELFLQDSTGAMFSNLRSLSTWLGEQGKELRVAMNAGMFHPDLTPVGLFVQDGHQVTPLNVSDGTGNFFMKPNGVFFIGDSGARIVATEEYPAVAHGVRLATQSGPLLVHNGELNPGFDSASTSRLVRNGIGVADDVVFFVISDGPVTFYELATYFRDTLHCPDALYLDGVISALYSVELQRSDSTVALGPIIGVVR